MISGVSWSSRNASRSRRTSFLFFSLWICSLSPVPSWSNASIAASRSRCSCRRRSNSACSRARSSSLNFSVMPSRFSGPTNSQRRYTSSKDEQAKQQGAANARFRVACHCSHCLKLKLKLLRLIGLIDGFVSGRFCNQSCLLTMSGCLCYGQDEGRTLHELLTIFPKAENLIAIPA